VMAPLADGLLHHSARQRRSSRPRHARSVRRRVRCFRDFDDLIEASSPTLAAIDPYAETVLASRDVAGLAKEIDALLANSRLTCANAPNQ